MYTMNQNLKTKSTFKNYNPTSIYKLKWLQNE